MIKMYNLTSTAELSHLWGVIKFQMEGVPTQLVGRDVKKEISIQLIEAFTEWCNINKENLRLIFEQKYEGLCQIVPCHPSYRVLHVNYPSSSKIITDPNDPSLI